MTSSQSGHRRAGQKAAHGVVGWVARIRQFFADDRCRTTIDIGLGYERCYRKNTPGGHEDGMHDAPYVNARKRGVSWGVQPHEPNYLDPRKQRTC